MIFARCNARTYRRIKGARNLIAGSWGCTTHSRYKHAKTALPHEKVSISSKVSKWRSRNQTNDLSENRTLPIKVSMYSRQSVQRPLWRRVVIPHQSAVGVTIISTTPRLNGIQGVNQIAHYRWLDNHDVWDWLRPDCRSVGP